MPVPDCYDAWIEFPDGTLTEIEIRSLIPGECQGPFRDEGIVRISGYVPSGEFPSLEACLSERDLPFDRWTGGDWECMPYVLRRRPGASDHWSALTDTGCEIVVPLPRLVEAATTDMVAVWRLIAELQGPGPLREWMTRAEGKLPQG